jgi:PleD family two-component response regulator
LAARLPSTPSSVALLAAADAALYAAKQAGRNRVSIDPAARARD